MSWNQSVVGISGKVLKRRRSSKVKKTINWLIVHFQGKVLNSSFINSNFILEKLFCGIIINHSILAMLYWPFIEVYYIFFEWVLCSFDTSNSKVQGIFLQMQPFLSSNNQKYLELLGSLNLITTTFLKNST